jgi:hypothetical protein
MACLDEGISSFYPPNSLLYGESLQERRMEVTNDRAPSPTQATTAWIALDDATESSRRGETNTGVQGVHLTPRGFFLRTSTPCILRFLSAFPPA